MVKPEAHTRFLYLILVEKSATVAEDDSAEQPLRKFVMALPMPITVSQPFRLQNSRI